MLIKIPRLLIDKQKEEYFLQLSASGKLQLTVQIYANGKELFSLLTRIKTEQNIFSTSLPFLNKWIMKSAI